MSFRFGGAGRDRQKRPRSHEPPHARKGIKLKTTDTYPPHTHNIRKHVQRGACIMYAIHVCVCVCVSVYNYTKGESYPTASM